MLAIRNIRSNTNEAIKKASKKDGLAEDIAKGGEDKVQKINE
jgi:ribosome recycling factor